MGCRIPSGRIRRRECRLLRRCLHLPRNPCGRQRAQRRRGQARQVERPWYGSDEWKATWLGWVPWTWAARTIELIEPVRRPCDNACREVLSRKMAAYGAGTADRGSGGGGFLTGMPV